MILDDMIAAAPYLRPWFQDAHVVRVPFEVFPLNVSDETIYWTDSAKIQSIVPKTIDDEWTRSPYPCFIMVSQNREPSCVHVIEHEGQYAATTFILYKNAVMICNVVRVFLEKEPNAIRCEVPITGDAMFEKIDSLERMFRGLNDSEAYASLGLERIREGFNREHTEFDAQHISVRLLATLALFNCRNITSEEVRPPARLQKARQRQGRLPLLRHHVLTVHRVGKAWRVGESTGKGEPLALHWVRGHFKSYTSAKPLLGRHVGRFWFSPHLAGKADRAVTKEYRLEE